MLPQNQIQISSIQGNKLSIKERVFLSRRFGFKSNFDLLATQLTPTSNEQMIIIKSRLSLIVWVNVVLNRTVVVDSD